MAISAVNRTMMSTLFHFGEGLWSVGHVATMPRPTGPAVAMAAPPVEVEVEAPAEELEAESEVAGAALVAFL
jgi:hypothetical protein